MSDEYEHEVEREYLIEEADRRDWWRDFCDDESTKSEGV